MRNIAVFLGELQLDTQRKVLEGIAEAAKADGNNVVVYCLTLSKDEEFNIGESAAMQYDDFSIYDGFIIYSESIYSEKIRNIVIEKIRSQNRPCASIDCPIEGMINVSSDNESAMRALSDHLINEHKIKTVNFIGGPEDSIDAVTRKRVFIEEMEKAGLKFDEERYYVGDYYARSGRAAVKYFEKKGLLKADAYVCANDQMALGAFYALGDRGIRAPEDTLMSGYDNIFEAANNYPRITSVSRSEKKIGETAYRNVIKCIEGKKYNPNPVIESNPVFAESCGCDAVRPVNHRIVEALPIGVVGQTDNQGAGVARSYLFRPMIEFDMKHGANGTTARVLTYQKDNNATVQIAVFEVSDEANGTLEPVWLSEQKQLDHSMGEHILGPHSSCGLDVTIKPEKLYYVAVVTRGGHVGLIGISNAITSDTGKCDIAYWSGNEHAEWTVNNDQVKGWNIGEKYKSDDLGSTGQANFKPYVGFRNP